LSEQLLHVFVAKTYTSLAMNQVRLVAVESGAHVINSQPILELVAPNEAEHLSSTR